MGNSNRTRGCNFALINCQNRVINNEGLPAVIESLEVKCHITCTAAISLTISID